MAGCADHKGFASPFRHERHPRWLLWLSGFVQVGEFADVVHPHALRLPAQFAPTGKEPTDKLFAPDRGRCWFAIDQDRVPLLL